ncbi:MAG: TonB-dependent receptor [Pseudomonadota bacterium]
MKSKGLLNASACAAAIAALHLPSGAVAQSTAAKADDVVLEDIVVTADRKGFGADLVQVGTFRNARIIDVPLTVNVVSSDLLKSQGAQSLFDALRNTAGVSRAQTNGAVADNVTIRGITVENRTSFRLNGSLPIINLVDLPLENKERVEVLKGVGALYYGYAPPSGIVNLVTKRADRNVANFSASVNEFGGTQVTGDIGYKFSDSFGVRVNGAAGIVEPGISRFEGDRFMASLAADLKVTDGITLRFDFEHIHKNVTEPATLTATPANSPLTPPATVGVRILPPIPDPTINLGGTNLRSDAQATNMLIRADIRLSSQFALTLEAGQARTIRYRDSSTLQNTDLRPTSASYGVGQLVVSRARDQQYKNQNLRGELAGAFPTGPIVHNFIAGVTLNKRFQNGAVSPAVTVNQNFFNPIDIQLQEPTSSTQAPLNIDDFGAYVTDRAKIGPVELLAGARYSNYQSNAVSATGVVTDFKIETWTPAFGVVLKPMDNLSIYGTYLQGLEETQPAPLNSARPFEVLPPSKSTQYEAGIKFEPRKGLLLQLAGFQIERASAFTDPVDNVYKLAGRSRYKGIEGSLTGDITREIAVYLSGLYIDAEVTSAVPATLIGKRPENTAEWTGSAYVEYKPVYFSGFAISGGALYNSSRPINALNEAFIDGYTTFSGSVRYTFEGVAKGLTVQLNGENLFDKRYWAGTGSNLLSVGLPRTVKLTARVSL